MNTGLTGFELLASLALVELLQLAVLAENNGHLVGHISLVLFGLEDGWLLDFHWATTGVALLIGREQTDDAGNDGLVLAQLLLNILLVLGVQHLWASVVAWLGRALDGGISRGGLASGGQMVD